MIIACTILALLLESACARWPGFFRAVYFMPYGVPGVIATILWSFLYVPGLSARSSSLLQSIGLQPDFLGANTVLWSIANIVTWTYTGYNMLIIVAQLKSIPGEVYEAAKVDGAGAVPGRVAHPAPADRAGAGAHDGVLDHRHPAALRRAAGAVDGRPGDRHRVHAEPRRLHERVRVQRVRRRRGAGGHHRAGRVHPVVRVPRADEPDAQGRARPAQARRRTARRPGARSRRALGGSRSPPSRPGLQAGRSRAPKGDDDQRSHRSAGDGEPPPVDTTSISAHQRRKLDRSRDRRSSSRASSSSSRCTSWSRCTGS